MSAFRLIHDTQSSVGSGTSLVVTIPAVAANNLLVINLKFGTNVSGISVTDNASTPNTYAAAKTAVRNGALEADQFYGVAVKGGATQVTISWTGSAACRATIDEFTGGAHSNAAVFDKAASNTGNSATSASLTLAPTSSDELIVAGIAYASTVSTVTAGTNYRLANNGTNASSEYRAGATTSETAPISWTGLSNWAEIAGAYNPLPTPNAGNFMHLL